jgi:hypothetical protein
MSEVGPKHVAFWKLNIVLQYTEILLLFFIPLSSTSFVYCLFNGIATVCWFEGPGFQSRQV